MDIILLFCFLLFAQSKAVDIEHGLRGKQTEASNGSNQEWDKIMNDALAGTMDMMSIATEHSLLPGPTSDTGLDKEFEPIWFFEDDVHDEGFEPNGLNEKTESDGEPNIHSVCGYDSRSRIHDTDKYPYEAIADLKIEAANGKGFQCSAFFVSDRVLLTAGHCVHLHSNGGLAKRINVCPGRDGSKYPYGCQYASKMVTVSGWTSSRSSSYDYAALVLPNKSMSDKGVGKFPYKNYPSSELQGRDIYVAGYPGDKGGDTLWTDIDPIATVESRRIRYHVDTSGGMSGGPVWKTEIKTITINWPFGQKLKLPIPVNNIVGIHTNGGCPNKAVRVQSSVKSFIDQQVAKYP